MSGSIHILLVGPLPPPAGGMANQTRQLRSLLESENVQVSLVQTNAAYRPAFVGRIRGLRALCRLIPYAITVWRKARFVDVVHVMANSGWAWRLVAAPAIRLAKSRGRPVVVNYRGGLAGEFLAKHAAEVRRDLEGADALVVPSRFLMEIFARHGLAASIVPNVVDTVRFRPAQRIRPAADVGHVVVARNLEHLYGNDLALRAFQILRARRPRATLTIAGSGPERGNLGRLATELGVCDAVTFTGPLDVDGMAELYRRADVVLNPTRADNAPNSVLEALASGVPVVSTDVGGVSYLVENGTTALLVGPESPEAIAEGLTRVLEDRSLHATLVANGLELARSCAWPAVRDQWLTIYRTLATEHGSAGSSTAETH